MDHDAHIPETGKLLLEAVECVGIAYGIAARQEYLRQIARLQQVGGLMGQIDGILQHLQFRTVLCRKSDVGGSQPFTVFNELFPVFVSQFHLFVDGQSAKLAEQHLRQYQTVGNLHECHLSLVDLHADVQPVAPGGYTLIQHFLHIVVQFLHQLHKTLCQLLLMA
jgi:hypothetical protein